jgi:hypothetical protein
MRLWRRVAIPKAEVQVCRERQAEGITRHRLQGPRGALPIDESPSIDESSALTSAIQSSSVGHD